MMSAAAARGTTIAAPAVDAAAFGPSVFSSPAIGSPSIGSPAIDAAALGSPRFGSPTFGTSLRTVGAASAVLFGTTSSSPVAAATELAQAGERLKGIGAYRFRIELSGSFARGGPVRGSKVVVTGTVLPGVGRMVRFDATGAGADPSVTYLERGRLTWLLLPTGRWLSVAPADGTQPGAFTHYFPAVFYAIYDWPWLDGARLVARRPPNAVPASVGSATASGSAGPSARPGASALAASGYVVDPTDLMARAAAAGFRSPVAWSLAVTVGGRTRALASVLFSGRTTDSAGQMNLFRQALWITPTRRAALPDPR